MNWLLGDVVVLKHRSHLSFIKYRVSIPREMWLFKEIGWKFKTATSHSMPTPPWGTCGLCTWFIWDFDGLQSSWLVCTHLNPKYVYIWIRIYFAKNLLSIVNELCITSLFTCMHNSSVTDILLHIIQIRSMMTQINNK